MPFPVCIASWSSAVVPPACPPSRLLPGRWVGGTLNIGLPTPTKVDALVLAARARRIDVVALQETGNPSAEVSAALAAAQFWTLFSPRTGVTRPSGGTGLLVCARRFLPPVLVGACSTGVEYMVADVRSIVGCSSTRVMVVYAPPHSAERPLSPSDFASALAAALHRWTPDLAFGDFNARDPSWDPSTTLGTWTAQRGRRLLDLACEGGFSICAPSSATCTRSTDGSILDLALVRSSVVVRSTGTPLECGSDHKLATFAVTATMASPAHFRVHWRPEARIAWHRVDDGSRKAVGAAIAQCLLRRGVPRTAGSASACFLAAVRRCTEK